MEGRIDGNMVRWMGDKWEDGCGDMGQSVFFLIYRRKGNKI